MSDLICRNTMTACQTPGMCRPHGGCRTAPGTETVDSTWLAQMRTEFAEASRQRDLFAQAIADAAHKAGIIHGDAQCDGPTLLMVLNDLVGCVERADAERKQLAAIVELTPELEQDGETLISLVTQAKNAVVGATVAWEEQCARADKLEAEVAGKEGATTDPRYSKTSADTERVAAPVRVHQANVFLPGCLGPVRHDVVLEDDYRDTVMALEGEVEHLTKRLKNPEPGSEVVDSMWLAELCARADQLEDEAAMRRNIEHAAQHLPAGWLIRVSVEFEGSSVELINPDGEDVDFPSNHESLAQEVRDAVDALINPEPEDAGELPPPPAGLVDPVPGPDERICWQDDCICCGGTGREPDGSRCLGEIPF